MCGPLQFTCLSVVDPLGNQYDFETRTQLLYTPQINV